MRHLWFASALVLGLCLVAWSDGGSGGVLGACGTPNQNAPGASDAGLVPAGIPLPGQRAYNFELPAVIGDAIKPVKLSDYAGKWRVLCFYPADFTFV